MIFKKIVFDFINNNKKLIYSYITVSSLVEIIKVIVLSYYYSKIMKDVEKFNENILNIMFVWVALCVLYVIKTSLETPLYSDILFYVRNTLYKKYIKHNYYNFNDVNTSTDVIQIFEVARTIRDAFYFICQHIIPTIILSGTINIYFLVKYTNIGIINIISNIVNYLIIKYFSDEVIILSNNRQQNTIQIISKLQESFGNMMDIFLNGKDDNMIQKSLLLEQNYAIIHKNEFTKISNFINLLKINNYIFSLISIYILYKSYDNEDFMNGLLIFTFYISVLQELSENIPKFITMIGNIDCMEDILGPKLEDNEIIDNGIMPHINGMIQFQNINFSYMKDKIILNSFNMNIKMGERVAIIAPSGSGKTTIMKLLLKFYKPQQGVILLDNININDINTKYVRKHINYINQKTILFNDTIINNMKYGNEKSDAEIFDLLQQYDLLYLFNNDINELQKIVEINGTNISMGIQKIIFLVRGILKTDCSIYVFDEPLTSLDMNTRKKVMKMINNIVRDKTTIIITHDIEINSIVHRVINLGTNNN